MNITIEYVAQMRSVAGMPAETVDLPVGTTAQDVIRSVAERHGGRLAELLLDENGVLRPSALVFADDEQVEWETAQTLREGSKVTILAPLAGG